MASFVDVMSNDIWTEADIVARTEAMIQAAVSAQEQAILSRKMIAFSMGRLIPTADEAALLERFERAAYDAQAAGVAAREDMALLAATMAYEAAAARLGDALLDPEQRAAAEAVIDEASEAVVELFTARLATRGTHPASDLPEQLSDS